jgi:serine/threonine protein kinase
MDQIGPWRLSTLLYNKRNISIFCVDPIFNDDVDDEIKKEITNKKWVMKYFYNMNINDVSEVNKIEYFELYKQPFIISMPSNRKFRSDCYKQHNESWYVMEKYESSIRDNLDFCIKNINLLALNILDVLEWLHLTKNCIHGDIKADNILINVINKERPFCLIDYETIDKIYNVTCENTMPYGYYYYALGCDFDKSCCSFRMDLQSLGLLLWNVLLSNCKFFLFNWQKCALKYYNQKCMFNYYKTLNLAKKYELDKITKPELIKNYFTIIDKLDWSDTKINPDIYKELRNLFDIK